MSKDWSGQKEQERDLGRRKAIEVEKSRVFREQ